LIRVAFAVLLAAALAGCGGERGSLEDSAEATAAETSRFEMTMRFAGSAKSADTLEAVGAFDYPNERAAITISGDFPFLGEKAVMKEVRVIGRTTYMRWLVENKEYWIKDEVDETSGDPNELLIPFPGSATTPTDVLTRVLLASKEHEELGTEDVRGVQTTHYRARVDIQKLVEQLPANERPNDELVERWRAIVPVDVWIDDESRLRRITISPLPDQGRDTTTLELFDYGVDVDVEAPPADELTSQAEFDKLIEPLFEVESEAGEELLSPEEVCKSARENLPKKEADEVCRDVKENQ
jgi:hypothetical protein